MKKELLDKQPEKYSRCQKKRLGSEWRKIVEAQKQNKQP
jgi:hypothetical protein